MTTQTAGRARLRRDRLTLTMYAPFITWGWFLYGFSPAVPLIAEEFGVSRSLASLHGTAMALGGIVVGLVGAALAARFGRLWQSVGGSTAVAVGVSGLLLGGGLATTLPAAFLAGIGGNLLIAAAQPALSVHHGDAGPAAVTEANAMGAAFGLFAPLAVGASVGLGWGWRPAVAVVVVLAVATALLTIPLRRVPALGRSAPRAAAPGAADAPAVGPTAGVTSEAVDAGAPRRGFSRTFWFFWVAMLCGIAVEFATTFWASDLLLRRTGAPASVATAALSALVIGMCASRFIVGPLSMRKAPEKLLLVGFAVALLGWAVFWTTQSPAVAVAGLVIAGLGYGTHYPLSVALTLRASAGRPDQAQGLASFGGGLAVGVAPFALAAVADALHSTHLAFLLVGALLVVGGVAVALGLRSVHDGLRTAAAQAV